MAKNKEDVTQAVAEGVNTNHDTNARSALTSPSSNTNVPQNAQGVNNNISTDGSKNTLTEAEEQLINTPDAELTPEQRAVKQSLIEKKSSSLNVNSQNSTLQSEDNGGIINKNDTSVIGDEVDGSTNTELLARGEISAVGGSGNGIRQQSENSRKLAGYLEKVGGTQGEISAQRRAGESGWLVRTKGSSTREGGYSKGLLRTISRIKPSGKDTDGRTLDSEIAKDFEKTVFKDKNGNLLFLYHWTTAVFDKFAKGEFGFHLGVLDAAHDRYMQIKEEYPDTPIGTYKEVYVNIINPIEMMDNDAWDACWVSLQLKEKGILPMSSIINFLKWKVFMIIPMIILRQKQ